MDFSQNEPELCKSSAPGKDKEWWENGSEGHRFAGEVLQLRVRREIMRFIGSGIKTREEIGHAFELSKSMVELHLALLEKAVMIEKVSDGKGYRSTPIGIAYLKIFDEFAPKLVSDQRA